MIAVVVVVAIVVCVVGVKAARRLEVTGRREVSGVLDANGRYIKDPERMFPQYVIFEAKRRCEYRCERVSRFGRRCTNGEHNGFVLHADHWIPHSKGGASSEGNIVILCSVCNLAKSSEVPFIWQTNRVYSSRLSYMINARRPGARVQEGDGSNWIGTGHPAVREFLAPRSERSTGRDGGRGSTPRVEGSDDLRGLRESDDFYDGYE